jgi:putative ABC transport system permease protein
MLKNYLKLAFRSLLKNKTSSFINIAGLSGGMAVAMLIGLWIWDELSFDQYHQNHERLVQVMDTRTFNHETTTDQEIAIPLAKELRKNYGDNFKYLALCFTHFTHILSIGDKKIFASGVWAEPDLPKMLTLKMVWGKNTALDDPSAALLNKTSAEALFGKEDPIGKTIKLDNSAEVKIGGVFEDLPKNTSFNGTEIFLAWDKAISVLSWVKDYQDQWPTHFWKLYAQLNANVDMNRLNEKIENIPQQHVKEGKEKILLYPMDKWHLYNEFKNGKMSGGRIRYVVMFGLIGVFVLLLACINFMNLSTAKSGKRAKEVGIRKTIGSLRRQLIFQFLTESILVALLSFLIAIGLVFLALPSFNRLTDKEISSPFFHPVFLLLTLTLAVLTGIIAGSYPAFYLSSFRPAKVIKGVLSVGHSATLARKVMVVGQFTLSIAIIIGTIIIYKQILFAKDRPTGYDRKRLLAIQMNSPQLYAAPYNSLRNDLLQSGAVENMAQSDILSTDAPYRINTYDWKGKPPGAAPQMGISVVTHDYGSTIRWQIATGRDFSRTFPTDTNAVILNESAAKLIGFANPVGETIYWDGASTPHPVVGVVKDMVMESPFKPVQPTVFALMYGGENIITIRLTPAMPISEAMTRIKSVFRKYDQQSPFAYKFIEDEYARKFSDIDRISKITSLFSILAIFISFLGIFGLTSFVAEQRTKEIGVRKVLGASVFNIWRLISQEFLLLVVLFWLISIPIAYLFMKNWLQDYDYRTSLSWWIFAIVGAGILIITLLSISFKIVAAAVKNPIISLRTE